MTRRNRVVQYENETLECRAIMQCIIAVAKWVRALGWRPGGPAKRWSAEATSLRNFGNSVYPALPVSIGRDTTSRQSLLSVVYARGSKRSHQPTLEMCNLSWTPHSSIEKDNSLNHSCVSPKTGCLEYT